MYWGAGSNVEHESGFESASHFYDLEEKDAVTDVKLFK